MGSSSGALGIARSYAQQRREHPIGIERISSIKVLYVSPVGERGGAETVLLNILKHHDLERFTPIACVLKEGPLVEQMRRLGVRTFVFPTTRFRDIRRTLRVVGEIRRVVKNEDVDIVFGNMAMGHLYGGLASFGTRAKRVWFQHGIPKRNDPVSWLAALLPAERIYANSRASLQAQERFRSRAKKVQILYPGLDAASLSDADGSSPPLKQQFGIPEGAPVVAMVARFQRWKGQHVFIQAAAEVRHRFPNVRFLLIGDTLFGLEPGYKKDLKALVERLGLSQHVIFTGFRNDVPTVLKEVVIVVHPPILPEPFGLAVAEALLMRKPVVASNQGGPSEIVVDGETGFLVPPGDAKALAEKVLLLLSNEDLRRRMGKRGRAMILERFTMKRMITELEDSYLEVLGLKAG